MDGLFEIRRIAHPFVKLVSNKEKACVRKSLHNLSCRAQEEGVILLWLKTGEHADDWLPCSHAKFSPKPSGFSRREAFDIDSIVNHAIGINGLVEQLAAAFCSGP